MPIRIRRLADEKKYLSADFDISRWVTNDPIGQWDWKGIWAWRGNGFFARDVEIPNNFGGQETVLGLAESHSYNEIYINGKHDLCRNDKRKARNYYSEKHLENGRKPARCKNE